MYNTKVGNKVHKIRNHEILTIGSREGNFTSQRHFQVDYPKDLN